jgi:hypothetical protein
MKHLFTDPTLNAILPIRAPHTKTDTTEQTSGCTGKRNRFRAGRVRAVDRRDHQPPTAGALPLLTRRGSATSLDPEASWTSSRSIDAASKQLVRQQIHKVTTSL